MNSILHKINSYIPKVSIIFIIFWSIIINSYTNAFNINADPNWDSWKISYTREQTSDNWFLYTLTVTATRQKNWKANIEINKNYTWDWEFELTEHTNTYTETLIITGETTETKKIFDYPNLFTWYWEWILEFNASSKDNDSISGNVRIIYTNTLNINVERNWGLWEMSYTRDSSSNNWFWYTLTATAVRQNYWSTRPDIEINKNYIWEWRFEINEDEHTSTYTETLIITGFPSSFVNFFNEISVKK